MNEEDKTIIEQKISELEKGFKELLARKTPDIPFSEPNLTPQQRLYLLREIIRPVSGIVFGDAAAAVAANYGTFFVSDRSYYVISATERHRAPATDGSPVTLDIEKCASGVAQNSGVLLLSTPFDLKGTANTPQFGTLTATKTNLILKKGDCLVLKDTGVLTSLSDVCVTILLQEF